jgi:hypothetical protein
VTSLRAARFTTSPPAEARRNPNTAVLPHWPGETHTWPVTSIMATRAKFVGLKTCLAPTRRRNLLPIAVAAVSTARVRELVRSRRQSDSPEISALFGSKPGRPDRRVPANCARRTVARIAMA